MRYLKALYLLIGVALLAAVIAEIEVAEVGVQIGRVGYGFLVILGIYFVAFSIDSVTWQMTIRGVPLNGLWAYRAWVLRMAGLSKKDIPVEEPPIDVQSSASHDESSASH